MLKQTEQRACKRRLGWIREQWRFNPVTTYRWRVWQIILSNGRLLCECPNERAAKRIYKALSSHKDS